MPNKAEPERHKVLKNMGFCLQQNILYDSLTVNDYLCFIAKLREIPNDEIDPKVQFYFHLCFVSILIKCIVRLNV